MSGPALTPREDAVLAAVGRRLNNSEIAAELFISVRTVESHIASLRRKLLAGSRVDLVAAARERRGSAVPVPDDPLRGRGRDLARVRAVVDGGGWMSVVGAGGVGKTRLALEIARRSRDRDAAIVELEHATPDDVVTRIARTLGLEAAAGDVGGAVSIALTATPHLLVLDNADRVGPATARAVTGLRGITPGLAVIVTSRTPLGASGEVVHVLDPLATDGIDSPAGALLADRLGAVGIALHPGDREIVHRLAARLDGLPLALELAASVARHLPLRELDERLAGDLAALERAVPFGRHRTLETAFEWTWDLLSAQEQETLRRLAALPRTFDIDLAVAVSDPSAAGTVLRLLDHSLIVPTRDRPGRFRLLAVMREFVHARTDPALIREVLERHAATVTDVAAAFIATARTDCSPEAAHTSSVLCPEVNAALRWMLAAAHPAAPQLASALAIGVEQHGADLDSVAALAEAARNDPVLAVATPEQLLVLGTALAFVDVGLLSALAERALQIAVTADDSRAAHQLAGWAAAYRAEPETALEHLAEAERLALDLNAQWDLGSIRQARGIALRSGLSPDLAGALDAFDASMRAYARAGDAVHVNNVRFMMASVAAELPTGRDRAVRWAAEARAAAEGMLNEHEAAHARIVQATLGLAEAGDLRDLVGTFRRLGDLRCVHRALMLRASTADRAAERIALLQEAAGTAATARDTAREIASLEALVRAHHDAGDTGAALAALDRMRDLAGAEHAHEICPPALRVEFAGA